MAIHYEDKDLKRYINVISFTGLERELEHLKLLLSQEGFKRYEIYFYDTEVLSAKTIEILAHYMSLLEVKVYVHKKFLCDYLNKLGISATRIQNTQKLSKGKEIRAIALGGSTDSLDKIFEITEKVILAEVAIFVVQHIREDTRNLLADLLKGRTRYTVVSPAENMPVEIGTIYVAPSGAHMVVRKGMISLLHGEPENYARPSIDVLFEALSAEYKEGLLTILLCGYGSDGVKALTTVRKNGGQVIVEDPSECGAKDLVLNALKQERYRMMKVVEMIDYINKNIRQALIWEDVKPLLESVSRRTGYDFSHYQSDSMIRRVNSYVYKEKNMTLKEFNQEVMENEEGVHEILSGLTVKTTEFYRDGQVYEILRNKILNYLNSYQSIKIWCAGCSTGEEAYSIAMLLEEVGLLEKSLIYATDLGFNNILQAKNGLYVTEELKKANKNYDASGGTNNFLNCFIHRGTYSEIKSQYKDHILFFQHSLVDSGVLNEFQLIVCRNVLMYFNNELQEKTLQLFSESLDISGFLVLGKSEGILTNGGAGYFIERDAKNRIYKRKFK